MKPQYKVKFVKALGVDKRLNPQMSSADNIQNCRWDEETGWIGNIGYESWWKFPPSFQLNVTNTNQYLTGKVDSVYQWTRADSNDTYTFVEQNGRLYYFLGNKGQGSTYTSTTYIGDLVVVDDKRHIPKLSDISTQYVNLGKQLLIINGYDRAILFSGDHVWRDFGWTNTASAPQLLVPDTGYIDGAGMQDGIAIWFDETSIYGIGSAQDQNQYGYRISFISDTGSESPQSIANFVSWKVGSGTKKKYAVGLDLPLGPQGTVARRIYRTKNIVESGEVYYFLKEINDNSQRFCVDYFSDQFLISTAPSILDSQPITSNFQIGENWDGRLWLAKGNKVYYSHRGLWEQFGAADYFDVSNLTGGDITGLKAFYNNLFVFRETAINVISTNGNGYSISTVNSTIGTRATNGIVLVPSLGVMFLNDQGVWILSGGLNGGSQIQLINASHPIDRHLKDMNLGLIHKTIAAFSPLENEVWFHYPQATETVPNVGAVYHLNTDVPFWSFRGEKRLTSMCTTRIGEFLFGQQPIWDGSVSIPGKKSDNISPLLVVSKSHYDGQSAEIKTNSDGLLTIDVTSNEEIILYSWESAWISFDDNSAKHRVYAVELEMLSMGDNPFDFTYGKDFSFTYATTPDQKQAKSDTVYTNNEWTVFGPANTTITKVPFRIGSSQISDRQIIRLRYDCNTELKDQFKFILKSQTQFHILGFNILFDTVELPVLNQNKRLTM